VNAVMNLGVLAPRIVIMMDKVKQNNCTQINVFYHLPGALDCLFASKHHSSLTFQWKLTRSTLEMRVTFCESNLFSSRHAVVKESDNTDWKRSS
jgi:hypothetical protein